jgi:sigma-B regulation protein RsbU (phosphoserine phosphatase)
MLTLDHLPGTHPSHNGHAPHPGALETARQVQQRLFPRRLPHVPGWDFAACCRPAQAVGGDYYDLFPAGPGRLAVAVGDVSGKGLGPALVMAHLHGLVRGLLPADPADLGGFAANLNDRLGDSLPDDWFVTLFLAVVDLADGRLSYVNAGHPPALLLDAKHTAPVPLTVGGTPLGTVAGEVYAVGQARVRPGGLLAVFSDGLTECRNPGGQMFRVQGVAEALTGFGLRPAEGVRAGLIQSAESFRSTAGQEDDMTLVVVRREMDDQPGGLDRHQGCGATR